MQTRFSASGSIWGTTGSAGNCRVAPRHSGAGRRHWGSNAQPGHLHSCSWHFENSPLMWTLALGVHMLWLQWTNSHGLQKSCGEKGMARPLFKWERAPTLAWTGFYCFSGFITWGWSSFTMHRFSVGDYLSQTTKERMLLITSKRRML